MPRTKNTVSPTPAPTESTATSVRPESRAVGGNRLQDEQRDAGEVLVLAGDDDVADDPGQLHGVSRPAATSMVSTMPTMAASTGQSFMPDGHPRGAAADDEHGLADAGVHGVDGDEVIAFGFAVGIHRAGHEQLVADEPRVLPRGDNGPDDAGQDHRDRFLATYGLADGGLADRQRVLEVGVRARDDVHRHQLADAARRGGAGVGGRLHGRDVAAHDGGDVAGADLLPADQRDLRGLDHGVGRLDHGDQPLGLDHSQRLSHFGASLTFNL